jgi:hypothetical protein
MTTPYDLIPLPTMPYDTRPDSLPLDVEECRTAIWRTRGNVTKAAQLLKIESIRLRRFIKSSPRLSAEIEEAQEQLLDKAEDNIADALDDTEDKIRADNAAKFVLTNLGARRGYGPKGSGITLNPGAGNGAFTISWGNGQSITEPKGNVIDHE